MPTVPEVFYDDPFPRQADAGHPSDDFRKAEGLKTGFNNLHNWIAESMDLNNKMMDAVIGKLEWALGELDKAEEDSDHTAIFQELMDAVPDEVGKFYNLYVQAEIDVKMSIDGIHQGIYPFEANSYYHHVNDDHEVKINEMIATHLYRQGLFDVADGFVIEAGDVELRDKMTDLRPQFKNLQDVVNAVGNCEIELPLLWVSDNMERLGERKAAELEFKIHAVKYIRMLEEAGARIEVKQEAVNYAKANLTHLSNEHNMDEMKMLYACLIYDSNELRRDTNSRYFHLFNGSYKQNLIAEIEQQFCLMMGQCSTDPLSTVTSVGAKFLAGVCKAANIVKEDLGYGWSRWTELGVLPLLVNLDEEFKFHSQFACPRMKKFMATWLNPPMALECGHVIIFQTALYNSAWVTGTTLCPFCYTYTFATNPGNRTVYF